MDVPVRKAYPSDLTDQQWAISEAIDASCDCCKSTGSEAHRTSHTLSAVDFKTRS